MSLSVIALLIYTAVTFALFKLIPVTLTLAGIAGFILSIGMAVDANVLIFARLKEELRAGRPLVHAIEAGFDHAWPSIRDSNISSMITAAILFWFGRYTGASIITGFAADPVRRCRGQHVYRDYRHPNVPAPDGRSWDWPAPLRWIGRRDHRRPDCRRPPAFEPPD